MSQLLWKENIAIIELGLDLEIDRVQWCMNEILTGQASNDTIKEFLISSNMPAIEGTLHRATVSLVAGRDRIDWETIARRFDPSHQLIAAHTSHGDPYHVVRVSARKGGK